MKKVLIVEDELLSARRLKKEVLSIDETLEVDGPLRTVDEVVDYLRSNNDYDLIFSDIRLLDGDVFEAFEIETPKSFVIFTTAYDEYAMQAIKSNGVDYLLKPIDTDELRAAMDKVNLAPSNNADVMNVVKEMNCFKKRFLVYKGDEMLSLAAADVLYFYKEGRKTKAISTDGNVFDLPVNIQDVEEQIDPDLFFRLNRQYIVNINAIKKISSFFNSKLKVYLYHCPEVAIVVSRERSAMFKEWLNK